MAIILDGKSLAEKQRNKIRDYVARLDKKPTVAVLTVGNDPASAVYVKNKKVACEEVGITFKHLVFDKYVITSDVVRIINSLNNNKEINGIMVQMPLPIHIDEKRVIESINPSKDVDCLTNKNFGKLIEDGKFAPCTARGILDFFTQYNIDIEGKTAVIIGRSKLAGQSTQILLDKKGATTILCHSKTPSLGMFTKQADILVSAVGKPHLITADMVKENAVVIDVGISRTEQGLKGDVDFENVKKVASAITPVPGGVGPMTVATLLSNIVYLTEKQQKLEKNKIKEIEKN